MGSAVKAVTTPVKKVVSSVTKPITGALFGTSQSTGALGTGQFRGQQMPIETQPFAPIKGVSKEQAEEARKRQQDIEKLQTAQAERLQQQAEALRTREVRDTTPSIAEAQLRAATERSLAQQLAAAKAARGGSAAARERQLARSQAEARRDVAQQAATARLQEEQARRRFEEESTQANLAKALQAEQLAAQTFAGQQTAAQAQRQTDLAQAAQDIAVQESDRASRQRLEELELQQNLALQGVNLSGFQSAAEQRSGLVSSGAAALAAMFSDKRLKKNIKKENSTKSYSDKNCKKNIKLENSSDLELGEGFRKGLKEEFGNSDVKKPELEKIETKKLGIEDKGLGEKFKKGLSKESAKKGLFGFGSKKKYSRTGTGEKLLQEQLASISDKECKKEIKEKDEDFNPKSFLDALQAYSYEYKDKIKDNPMAAEGRQLGVMAQDLEKAGPVGRSMVKETSEGKYVDYGQGFGAILAAQAHLNQRLSELEKKSKKKNKK